jgi:superfamily II DNA or RNA helicase
MEVFIDGTILGSLKVLEVYEYYDGPRLFASVNENGSVFLVLWIRSTGTTDEYYVQRMSFRRFRAMRDGEISLRDAFIRAEGAGLVVLQIERQSDEARIRPLKKDQIDQSLLPLEGEALKLDSPLPFAELKIAVPSISVSYARNGSSTRANALGMRPMQERAYEKRGEQYLLIKSPPSSGKSRALMFIALDKLQNQGIKQAIIVVPEKAIGASFHDEPLSRFGFWADWHVEPKWNLCNAPGGDNGGKVKAVGAFLESSDKVLICTHATFRFAVDEYGVEKFDNRLIAVDEFHHVSANPDNKLGVHLGQFIARNRVHIVAMTGSYFRGDAEAVLAPQDEAKFDTVTYTYYEQLNGYEYLKQLDIGYFFYSGSYVDDILNVLDPAEKTIIHIPNVNSRESTKDKIREVEHIMGELGDWQGTDEATGFQFVKTPEGRVLRIADLVDDDPTKRDRVSAALKDPQQKDNREYVDIIIALGMAKEGFDWIWCEHALTVGYRSSLTEIVQIIGRATRDAPGKTRARFTNLIAEPDASEEAVTEAVNDTLKAIAASLLMEQVLAPRFEFTPKRPQSGPTPGYDYGQGGYDPSKCNVGFNEQTGQFQIEIKGLAEPKSKEATRICQEDLNEVIAAFVQDKVALERGLFDEELVPEELTQVRMGKIIQDKYPELNEEDHEAVRQHAIAALNLTQKGKQVALGGTDNAEQAANTALIDGVRRFAMDVRELDIDLIDRINPFGEAYAILAKTMSEESLKQVAAAISAKRTSLTPEEAKELAVRAFRFKKERGRLPSLTSQDAWEKRMAEGAAAFVRYKDEGRYE